MNKQELIEKIGNLDKLYGEKFYVALDDVLDLVKQLDEFPRYVKNILARLRELPLHDREVWLKAIMGEFEQDFSYAKYREGYDQGKFEGEWVGNQLKDADKIRQELNKPVIPQFVAEHIEWTKKEDFHLLGAMSRENFDKKLEDWFYTDDNMELFARAWLDGYEVEKEPKYTVKFKATNQYLCDDDGVGLHISPSFRSNFRKSDLEKLSLTEVFDSPLFEVEEVTK